MFCGKTEGNGKNWPFLWLTHHWYETRKTWCYIWSALARIRHVVAVSLFIKNNHDALHMPPRMPYKDEDAPFITLICIRSLIYSLFALLSLTAAIYFHTNWLIHYVFSCPWTCPLTHSCIHLLVHYSFFQLGTHANTSRSRQRADEPKKEKKTMFHTKMEPHFIIHTKQKLKWKHPMCISEH